MSEGVAAQKQTQMIFWGQMSFESKTSMGLKHKELERL